MLQPIETSSPPVLAQYDGLTQAAYEQMKLKAGSWHNTLLLMFLRGSGLRIGEVAAVEAQHLGVEGDTYYVMVKRLKKRDRNQLAPVILHPNLAHPLIEYARGQRLKPSDAVFGLKKRQMQKIISETGERAIGRPVMAKEFRSLYANTVEDISRRLGIPGFNDLMVASTMLGHSSPRTTRDYYHHLSMENQKRIQEAIPV